MVRVAEGDPSWLNAATCEVRDVCVMPAVPEPKFRFIGSVSAPLPGVFSNGDSRTLAQVMVATFTNPNGLVSAGSNMYSVAANSGTPRIDTPGENSATTIQSGALEQSNVDLSQEFTNMIVSQRGFEANAKVVTTSDTLLQDITNLVR